LELAENRYDAKERYRRERRLEWHFDEDMRFNSEIDENDRRVRVEQKQREDLRRQHLVVQ
jgi:hypothetical protein